KLTRPGILDAVQQEQVFAGAPSRHGEGVSIASAGVDALHRAVIDRAGIERNQTIEASTVEREVFNFALPDYAGHAGGSRVDQRGLFGNRHLLDNIANLKPYIDHR